MSHPLPDPFFGGEGTLPLGPRVWGDRRLILADQAPGARYRNLFTGELLEAEQTGGGDRPSLALAGLFAHFPVALLHREAP